MQRPANASRTTRALVLVAARACKPRLALSLGITRAITRAVPLAIALVAALACAPAFGQDETPAPPPASASAWPPVAGSFAFLHVDVLPMRETGDGPRVLTDQVVLVEGDRITALAPFGSVPIPEGATLIDGTGRTLLPGLVDMHVHTWFEAEHLMFLAWGVTTVRNMFGSPQQLAWRDEIAAGERLGPTIFTAGPIVDGEPPIWPGSRVVRNADEARAAVQAHQEQGYDFVKVYERLSRPAYDALVAAAAEVDLPVDGHVPAAVGIEAALAAGQRTIEHLTGYTPLIEADDSPFHGQDGLAERLGAWQHVDPDKVAAAVTATREAGTWNCPTIVVMQKWLDAEGQAAELRRPHMRWVPPMSIGFWSSMMSRSDDSLLATGRNGSAARIDFVRALHEGGARLLLGTDMGNPWVVAGYSVHEEFDNFLAAGLEPYEALLTATRSPAECLGALDEFGTLAPGLRADLLLVDGDPLADITLLRRPVGTMTRGRWLPGDALRGRLDQAAAELGDTAPSR